MGSQVSYGYNSRNLLSEMINGRGQNISYEYDANGRLTKITRANGTVETLTYDAAGQITEILDVDKDGNVINRYTFQYDANEWRNGTVHIRF